eukprot:TRINITY_DN2663_c0_g1_i1.p2 TRINITY_DN2663_c0_g1~~TRINITY_DN2663_c0_g1_i1.p2  ORF type:complete len:138 (-),score=3.21 TRINITY_DN2663_c0_g1_i1:114-527(-)
MSNPYDLLLSNATMNGRLKKELYGRALVSGLISYLRRHHQVFLSVDGLDVEHALRSKSVGDFDERIVIKVNRKDQDLIVMSYLAMPPLRITTVTRAAAAMFIEWQSPSCPLHVRMIPSWTLVEYPPTLAKPIPTSSL